MTCAEVQATLSLYLYGELDFANEEAVESHLDGCAFCQLALSREKEWHAAVNKQQQDVTPEWLTACRVNLHERILSEPTTAAHVGHRVAAFWHGLFDFRLTDRSYRLAAVSFLVLIGFGAGRAVDFLKIRTASNSPFWAAGMVHPTVTRVQSIQPRGDDQVTIYLQQTQVREVSGSRDNNDVRAILLDAARESADPGIRMDSVEMLAGQSGREIQNAIVNTIRTDPNAAVRVRAIQSLREFPSDVITRGALEFALAHDAEPGVRAVALDALVPAQGDFQLTPQLLQTITDVMRSAQGDDYVRSRCAQILNEQLSANDIH
jgi:hypothetical protein